MKKKLLKAIVTSIVIAALPIGIIPASAAVIDESSADQFLSPTVTIGTSQSYSVTIPDSFTITGAKKSSTPKYMYSADANVVVDYQTLALDPGNTLNVAFGTTDETYTATHATATGTTLQYEIYSAEGADENTEGAKIGHNSNQISVTNGASQTDCTKPIKVGINRSNISTTGTYNSNLTFTVSIQTP